jgi:hypothetical protein
MKYRLLRSDEMLLPFAPKNRISEFEGTDNRAA